jgi:integrase
VLGGLIARLNKQGVQVKRLMPHAFRHTCASMLIADGADVSEVAEHLGHSNPTITLRVYAHFFSSRKRGTAERMGRLLSPSTKGAEGGAVIPLRRQRTSGQSS